MPEDLIFRVGDVRQIRHTVEADDAFYMGDVTCSIYNSGGAAVISGGVGQRAVEDADTNVSWDIWYLWNTTGATPGDYTYILRYVVAEQTLSLAGRIVLLSATSKFDRWVQRIEDWILESDVSEASRGISWAQMRQAALRAVEFYSRDQPDRKIVSQPLTDGVWEYALPLDWQAQFSAMEQVEYPVDAAQQTRYYLRPSGTVEGEIWTRRDYSGYDVDELRSVWAFTGLAPSTGEVARYTYVVPQVLSDSTDTIPSYHFEAVTQYAAGLALLQLASGSVKLADPNIAADVTNNRDKQVRYRQQGLEYIRLAEETWKGKPSLSLNRPVM